MLASDDAMIGWVVNGLISVLHSSLESPGLFDAGLGH